MFPRWGKTYYTKTGKNLAQIGNLYPHGMNSTLFIQLLIFVLMLSSPTSSVAIPFKIEATHKAIRKLGSIFCALFGHL